MGLLEPSGEPVNPSVGCCTRRAATSLGNPTPASVAAGRLVGPILVDALGPCLSLHWLSMKLLGGTSRQGPRLRALFGVRGQGRSSLHNWPIGALSGHPNQCAGLAAICSWHRIGAPSTPQQIEAWPPSQWL